MHNNTQSVRTNQASGFGMPNGAISNAADAGIDPMTLAQLDVGLFKSLRKIGHPRERICSALFLSYAEYDTIVKFMEEA